MKVLKTYSLDIPECQFTTLLLDGNMPRGKFTHIAQGPRIYELVWMSGGRLDEVSVIGIHDELAGAEISFV